MIKVIKHGHYRTCSCYNCGCIFTFEKEDVKVEDGFEYKRFEKYRIKILGILNEIWIK